MAVPDEFLCPITTGIMSDPVLGSDGHNYERAAITEWLRNHTTSPITRQTMTVADLRSNYSLKSMIGHYQAIPSAQSIRIQPLRPEEQHVIKKQYWRSNTVSDRSPIASSATSVTTDHYTSIEPHPTAVLIPYITISSPAQHPNQKKLCLAACAVILIIVILIIIMKQVYS